MGSHKRMGMPAPRDFLNKKIRPHGGPAIAIGYVGDNLQSGVQGDAGGNKGLGGLPSRAQTGAALMNQNSSGPNMYFSRLTTWYLGRGRTEGRSADRISMVCSKVRRTFYRRFGIPEQVTMSRTSDTDLRTLWRSKFTPYSAYGRICTYFRII